MIKLLPIVLIPILVLTGLGYWRFQASKINLTTSKSVVEDGPVEVPASLPGATTEDRIKVLEQALTKLVEQVNTLKIPAKAESNTSLESAVTELKTRVSALEKATPTPAAVSSKSTVYIPLGSGGGPWSNIDWYITEYEISLDPANYPGYSGMVLEVTFRLAEAAGTGSVRLYNVSDSSSTSSQLDTTSTTFAVKSSSSFTLPSGTKTYKLQVKSTSQKDLFIQSARIKVNF